MASGLAFSTVPFDILFLDLSQFRLDEVFLWQTLLPWLLGSSLFPTFFFLTQPESFLVIIFNEGPVVRGLMESD